MAHEAAYFPSGRRVEFVNEFESATIRITNALTTRSGLDPYVRLRSFLWLQKLFEQSTRDESSLRIRNEYATYLCIMLESDPLVVFFPFDRKPSESAQLAPLPEEIGRFLKRKNIISHDTGPILPHFAHQSPDGRAYIHTRQTEEGDVCIYAAVSQNPLDFVK